MVRWGNGWVGEWLGGVMVGWGMVMGWGNGRWVGKWLGGEMVGWGNG